MLESLKNLKIQIFSKFKGIEHPLFAPFSKNNVMIITAYVRQGNVIITYKGQQKTGHFSDNTLRKMFRGDIDRRKVAIQSFVGATAQLILNINS